MPKEKLAKVIKEEQIDKSGAWAFFNGASQDDHFVCGASGVLYLFDDHFLKFKASLEELQIIILSS